MQRKNTTSSFRHLRAIFLPLLMILCMTPAFAQSGSIKGKVLDEL